MTTAVFTSRGLHAPDALAKPHHRVRSVSHLPPQISDLSIETPLLRRDRCPRHLRDHGARSACRWSLKRLGSRGTAGRVVRVEVDRRIPPSNGVPLGESSNIDRVGPTTSTPLVATSGHPVITRFDSSPRHATLIATPPELVNICSQWDNAFLRQQHESSNIGPCPNPLLPHHSRGTEVRATRMEVRGEFHANPRSSWTERRPPGCPQDLPPSPSGQPSRVQVPSPSWSRPRGWSGGVVGNIRKSGVAPPQLGEYPRLRLPGTCLASGEFDLTPAVPPPWRDCRGHALAHGLR